MLCNYTIFPSWFCDRFICLGQVNGATIYSVYDRSGALVIRDDITNGETTEYVAGPNGTFAKYDGSIVTYLHNDIVGSAVSGTNSAGTVTWRQKHTPFGEELNAVAANKDEIGFTGHIKDSDTGLNYMQARYYDPVIGRFYSNDPVGFTPSNPMMFNRYAYFYNNPYNYTDPDGRIGKLINFGVKLLKNGGNPRKAGKEFVADVADSVSTLADPNSSGLDKAVAVFDLISPISTKDVTKGQDFYRGAKPGSKPDFTPRPNDFKVDAATGTVKPTHGVSVFDNPNSVSSNGFVPHKVDQSTVPDTLQIIQRGKDPSHFETTPKPGANLTPQQFIDACSTIGCSN